MKTLRMAAMVLFAFALVGLAGQVQAQTHSPYGPHYGQRGTFGPAYDMYWPGAEDPQWEGRGQDTRQGMRSQGPAHTPYGPHYGQRGTFGPAFDMYWPGAEDPQWQGRGQGMRPGMRSQGPAHTPYGPHYGQRGTFGPTFGMDWPGAYEKEYDEEEQRKLGELWMIHYDKVSPIRQEIRKKKQAINQELYSDNPDKQELDSLRQDLNELYSELIEEQVRFRQEAYEKTGVKYD